MVAVQDGTPASGPPRVSPVLVTSFAASWAELTFIQEACVL